MTSKEISDFIAENIKDLYPYWNITSKEKEIWAHYLRPFDIKTAVKALKEFYYTNPAKKPVLKLFVECCVNNVPPDARRKEKPDAKLDFTIRNTINGRQYTFYASANASLSDEIERSRRAQNMLKRVRESFCGDDSADWVVILADINEKPLDDGLRGKPAQEKAIAEILVGPDCPGKRWLLSRGEPKQQWLLSPGEKIPVEPGDPVLLANEIDDLVPF